MIVATDYDKNKNIMAISLVNALLEYHEKPVFLCVGSDKVIGDSVGVLVGELLSKKYQINGYVYGNLDNCVTARNLDNTIYEIKKTHPYSPIVVVDGVLGETHEIGSVKYYPYPSIPGGVYNKGTLVGDYSILGVVDVKGIDSLSLIKSVKLTNVIKMAEFIAESIVRAYKFSQNLIV